MNWGETPRNFPVILRIFRGKYLQNKKWGYRFVGCCNKTLYINPLSSGIRTPNPKH